VNQPENFLKRMQENSLLYGANAPFIEELYEQYLRDPRAVPEAWRAYFDGLPDLPDGKHDAVHRDRKSVV
jgi:2-oxoglutarate dehydrogenase E1 component